MKYFLILVSVFLLILSCKENAEISNSKNDNIDTQTYSKSEECIPYFDFDEVEYYHIEIEELAVFDLLDSKNLNDSILFSIIVEEKLSNISDSIYVDKLIDFGYSKKKIPSTDYNNLNSIFCSENYSLSSTMICTPFYRDIMVFKKSKSISGLVKLCFDCSQSTLVNLNNSKPKLNYGNKNWEELDSLLKKYQ